MYQEIQKRITESMSDALTNIEKFTKSAEGSAALQPLRTAVKSISGEADPVKAFELCKTIRSICWTIENKLNAVGPTLPTPAKSTARFALSWTKALRQDAQTLGDELDIELHPKKYEKDDFVLVVPKGQESVFAQNIAKRVEAALAAKELQLADVNG